MTNDNHYSDNNMFRGIRGIRWLEYIKPVAPVNDAIFKKNDTKVNEGCDENVSHCSPKPVTPETLT